MSSTPAVSPSINFWWFVGIIYIYKLLRHCAIFFLFFCHFTFLEVHYNMKAMSAPWFLYIHLFLISYFLQKKVARQRCVFTELKHFCETFGWWLPIKYAIPTTTHILCVALCSCNGRKFRSSHHPGSIRFTNTGWWGGGCEASRRCHQGRRVGGGGGGGFRWIRSGSKHCHFPAMPLLGLKVVLVPHIPEPLILWTLLDLAPLSRVWGIPDAGGSRERQYAPPHLQFSTFGPDSSQS